MGEKSFFKPIGTSGNERLRFRIGTRKGKVADIRGNEVEKKTLKLGTLAEVLEFAEQDLCDRFEWYVERFLRTRGGR